MKRSFLLIAMTFSCIALFSQAARRVVLEDFTGTWCGACPAGKTSMEDCINTYPGTIGITMHHTDGLSNAYTDSIAKAFAIPSYPTGVIDRIYSATPGQQKAKVASRVSVTSPVKVDFTSTYNSTTRALSVTVIANFVAATTGDMRISCILTEDGIVLPNEPQHNYYGSAGCYGFPPQPSSPWYNFPCDIATYVHDGVARVNLANYMFGTVGVIPASVTSGSTYSQSYSYTLPPGWNAAKVNIVAMVSLGGPTSAKSDVLNANKGLVGSSTVATGVNENDGNQIEVKQNAPNPFSDATAIQFRLNTSENVSVKIYNSFGQEIKTIVNEYLVPGDHIFYWTGDDEEGKRVASGVYYYSVSTSSASFTKLMILVGK